MSGAPAQSETEAVIYHIAHDLKASTRALRVLPEWISEDFEKSSTSLPGEVTAHLDMMGIHGRRLDRMIDDLLTYSRIGRHPSWPVTDVEAAIVAAISASNLPKYCQIETNFGENAELSIGKLDFAMLMQALLTNAAVHGVDTAGKTDISVITAVQSHWVQITVADKGQGVEPEFHGQIFQLMRTLKPRDRCEGSGMGLAIAAKICRVFGGAISVVSNPPAPGAAFIVRLPIKK